MQEQYQTTRRGAASSERSGIGMAGGRGRLNGKTRRARSQGLPVGVESRHSVRMQSLVGQRVPLHHAPCCLGRWCDTVTCQPPALRVIDLLECWARRNAGDSTDQLQSDVMCVSDGRKGDRATGENAGARACIHRSSCEVPPTTSNFASCDNALRYIVSCPTSDSKGGVHSRDDRRWACRFGNAAGKASKAQAVELNP